MSVTQNLLGQSYEIPEQFEVGWGIQGTNIIQAMADAIDGGKLRVEATAPADDTLENSSVVFWIDETAFQLKCKVRFSDGRIKTGTIGVVE